MTNASRDGNNTPAEIGLSNSDGKTIIRLTAAPGTNSLNISNGTTGTDFGSNGAGHDENGVPTMLALSSVDGITPIPIYFDSVTGSLLVKST